MAVHRLQPSESLWNRKGAENQNIATRVREPLEGLPRRPRITRKAEHLDFRLGHAANLAKCTPLSFSLEPLNQLELAMPELFLADHRSEPAMAGPGLRVWSGAGDHRIKGTS